MKRPILATLVTAGFLACLALVSSPTHADDVGVSVTVLDGMTGMVMDLSSPMPLLTR